LEGTRTDIFIDRQKVLIHNLAGQFSLLVKLAAIPTENVTAEIAASQAFQTKMETQTLVRSPISFPFYPQTLNRYLASLCLVSNHICVEGAQWEEWTANHSQITAAEELLMFSRELKELWLFGQLRDLGEGEGEGDIEENAKKVGEMVQALQGAKE
jgi:hypothetical protein